MNEQTELLREMCDLLRLIAEPQIAKRDEQRRASISTIAGKSKPRARAIQSMDGTKTQSAIIKEAKIDAGDMSRLVKSLSAESLLEKTASGLKLAISLPQNFFEPEGS